MILVDQLFNARSKFRAAVHAVVAVEELKRRVRCKGRHAAMYCSSTNTNAYTFMDTSFNAKRNYLGVAAHEHAAFDAKRKLRAAIYAVVAANEVQHWLDATELLSYYKHLEPRIAGKKFDPRREMRAAVYAVMAIEEMQRRASTFKPRRKLRAAVFAVMAARELRDRTDLVHYVRETLAWLGTTRTRPPLAIVQDFYKDAPMGFDEEDKERKRKLRAAVYAVMATHKLWHRHAAHSDLEERLNWPAHHAPPMHPDHYVHFDTDDAGTIMAHQDKDVDHRKKDFEARRKVLGDSVVADHAGMLHPAAAYHRSKSAE